MLPLEPAYSVRVHGAYENTGHTLQTFIALTSKRI